jgi:hypothetical protein
MLISKSEFRLRIVCNFVDQAPREWSFLDLDRKTNTRTPYWSVAYNESHLTDDLGEWRVGTRVPREKASDAAQMKIATYDESQVAISGGGGNRTRGSRSTSSLLASGLRKSVAALAAPQQRDPVTDRQELTPVDPRLSRVCRAWASLPEHVIPAIQALANSAQVLEGWSLDPPSDHTCSEEVEGSVAGMTMGRCPGLRMGLLPSY